MFEVANHFPGFSGNKKYRKDKSSLSLVANEILKKICTEPTTKLLSLWLSKVDEPERFAALYVSKHIVALDDEIDEIAGFGLGVGIIMLLYLPFRRYVLQKDISSRKLYVTPSEIVYEVSRPSFIPFWGPVTIEKHVPLSKVIDIIIEQGTCSALARYLVSCIITFLVSFSM
ncbi:hypothetical protein GQ457_16G011140 [Hibiscus cannabinus]